MAEPNSQSSVQNIELNTALQNNNVKEYDKPQSGYMPRGETGYSSGMMWRPNTDLALFNNAQWSKKGHTPDFSLKHYTWYPEMYVDEESNTDMAHFITTLPKADIAAMGGIVDANSVPTNSLERLISRTPSISLRAFKPNLAEMAALLSLFSIMFKLGSILFETKGGAIKAALKSAFDPTTFNKTISDVVTKVCFRSPIDSEKDIFKMFYQGVNAFYRRLVTGIYMTKYTMPFYNSNLYLKSNSGTWGTSTLLGTIGSMFESFIGSVDIMSSAQWQASGNTGLNGATGYDAINFEFSIFNRTSDDVYKNLRFIHTLIPEALWLQNGLFQVPGTLYDVEIPGRTRFYWCTAEFKCEYQGKTRYFTAYNINDLYKTDKLINTIDSKIETFDKNIQTLREEIAKLQQQLKEEEDKLNEAGYKAAKQCLKKTDLNPTTGEWETVPVENHDLVLGWKTVLYMDYSRYVRPDSVDMSTVKESENSVKKIKAEIIKKEKEINADSGIKDANNGRRLYANIASTEGGFTMQKIRPLNLIPDAYKINCTLNSLLPNNLNTYLYGMFEWNNSVPNYGEGTDRFTHSVAKSFFINLIRNGFINAADALKGSTNKNDQETLNSLNNAIADLNELG